jgi:hypothetical protein
LAAASRQRVKTANEHIDTTRDRLDHARNVLQHVWLQRTLRERRPPRGPR